MNDLVVTKKVMPEIVWNFEEMKDSLRNRVVIYSNLVVTEDSLKGCATIQKELASMRVKLDNERKEVKKVFSEPITKFESQVKELISIIEEVEKPIKTVIDFYESKRKEEKRQEIQERINKIDLPKEFLEAITIPETLLNKTATQKSIDEFLFISESNARMEMKAYEEDLQTLRKVLEIESKKLTVPFEESEFVEILKQGSPLAGIIVFIHKKVENQLKLEEFMKKNAENIALQEQSTKEPIQSESQQETSSETFSYDYRPKKQFSFVVTTSQEKIDLLIAFMQKNDMFFIQD